MSAGEFRGWQEFYGEEPWGFDIDNYRFGMVAAQCLNPHRKRGVEAFKPKDFFPMREPELTPEEKQAKLAKELRTTMLMIGATKVKNGG